MTFTVGIAVLHALLFVHTLWHEYTQQNERKFRKVRTLRILYITMQIVSMLWLLGDTLRKTINVDSAFWCKFQSHFVMLIPTIYYAIYLFQLLLRLEASFKSSYLALSRRNSYILRTLVFIPPAVAVSTLLLQSIARPDIECMFSWNPPDLNESISYCILEPTTLIAFKYHVFEGWVASVTLLNVTFGVIFTLKLRDFVKLRRNTNTDTAKRLKFEALIVKNDILCTVLGTTFQSIFIEEFFDDENDQYKCTGTLSLSRYWRLCVDHDWICAVECTADDDHFVF